MRKKRTNTPLDTIEYPLPQGDFPDRIKQMPEKCPTDINATHTGKGKNDVWFPRTSRKFRGDVIRKYNNLVRKNAHNRLTVWADTASGARNLRAYTHESQAEV